MTWHINDAVRAGFPVLFGVAGPSSSGKTYTGLRVGTGVQSVVGGELAVLDTEGSRALQYADRFKFKHVPFLPPFNALRYLEALRFIEKQGVRTCIVDSMSHEHEGTGGHLEMHEAELQRRVKAGWGSPDKLTFGAWAVPAAERRALVLYLQQTRLNLILCFRAKEKLVLMANSRGRQEPTSQGWQPLAGDEYAYEMKAVAVLPPRSKGVPDWSASEKAAKISEGMEKLWPPAGQPLDEETGARLARWSIGEKGVRDRPLNADKPRPSSQQQKEPEQHGDDPPDFVPEGGWPAVQKIGDWAVWSIKFLGTATRPMAEAWLSQFVEVDGKLSAKAEEGHAAAVKHRDAIKEALAGAMKREPK